MTKDELIKKALLSHKNLKAEFFKTLEPIAIMAWIHPAERLRIKTKGQIDDLLDEWTLDEYTKNLKNKLRYG